MAARVGETVEAVVAAVRDRTIVPAERFARNIGLLLLAILVLVALVLLIVITSVRVLTIATGHAWIAELILAGVFLLAGAILWRRRKSSS